MNRSCKKNIAVLLAAILVGIWSALFFSSVFYRATPPDSVGSVRLNIETYLAGKNQPTHSSVISFESPWNGYFYWMAYSPYPYGNGEEENPCIAASNDLLYWETPRGLANPIGNNEETGCNELKDPHILYREDLDRLEVWYLGRQAVSLGGDGTSLLLMRKYSNDGIHWSNFEIMAQTKYLSPSVLWDGNKYQMWAIGYGLWGTEGTFVYQESDDGIHWSDPVDCSIGQINTGIDLWHGAVCTYEDLYHFVFIDNEKQKIFYCSSADGIVFNDPIGIVNNVGYWNNLYRPALLFGNGSITCFYGVANQNNQWYISSSTGETPSSLFGLREQNISQMAFLQDDVVDTHDIKYHVKTLFRFVKQYFRIELFALALFEIFALSATSKCNNRKKYLYICIAFNLIISCGYIFCRFTPHTLLQWLAMCVAVILINALLDALLLYTQMNLGQSGHV